MKVKFVAKLLAVMRKQCFKRLTVILEFTVFIFEKSCPWVACFPLAWGYLSLL